MSTATLQQTGATVSDVVVAMLKKQGVRHVYGYLGASVVSLLKSIAKVGGEDLKFVLCRNELNAALAASAEAKATGRLAVVCATSGPGASNLVTGLLDAQSDHAPLLAITGDLATHKRGRESEFQELDQTLLFSPVVAQSTTLAHPEAVMAIMMSSIGKALNDHCAVHLCIPADIQDVPLGADAIRNACANLPIRPLREELPGRLSTPLISHIAKALIEPDVSLALVVGGGAAGVGKQVCQLAQLIGAPIISTLDGKGIVPDEHPNTVGVLGIFGSPAFALSQDALVGVSRIVAIGVDNVTPFITGTDGFTHTRSLIMIEKDFSAMGHYHSDPSLTLVGPLEQSIELLSEEIKNSGHSPSSGQKKLLADMMMRKKEFFAHYEQEAATPSGQYVHPVTLMGELSRILAERAALGKKVIISPDVGDNTVWMGLFLKMPGQERMVISSNMGVMGWGLNASIASKLACPDHTVISVAGDGGLMMSIQELSTAVQENTSFLMIILTNTKLKRVAGSPYTEFLPRPDFVKLAESLGATARLVSTNEKETVRSALLQGFSHIDANQGPFLLDVNVDPDAAAPMSSWKTTHKPLSFK